jgi:FMN-dependent NADH-azoreductase
MLADVIQQAWEAANPDGKLVFRDLIAAPVPHIENRTIAGFYSEPSAYNDEDRAAMQVSDTLVQELLAADDILISAPIYNFTVPSSLKAWIDQIVRPGYAFAMNEDGSVTGLVQGKRVFIALAYGLEYTGTELAPYDFLQPYLETVLGYIGMTDLRFARVEGTALDNKDKLSLHKETVYAQARALIEAG